MKRTRLVVLSAGMVMLAASVGPAARTSFGHVTLLVVPARFNVLQVAFDAASLAPVVLVSYQGEAATEEPLLHAWNGSDWVYISMQDFREANFLQVTPAQVLLVGDATLLPPGLLSSASAWCPKTLTIPTTEMDGLVNALGAHLHFSPRDWQWMAARYKMNLQDLNANRRRESWYDQRGYRDEWTPKLRWPLRRHSTRGVPPSKTMILPPAEVVNEPPRASAVPAPAAMEPRLEVPEPKRSPAEEPTGQQSGPIPPPGWQEKATSTELPVK